MQLSGIFSNLKFYPGSWNLKSSREFTAEEQGMIAKATVVASDYGNSVCFMMKGGGRTYIPLSNTSSLTVGQSVDMSKAKLLTLGREGEADIFRVEA